jgi:hypothetical protein
MSGQHSKTSYHTPKGDLKMATITVKRKHALAHTFREAVPYVTDGMCSNLYFPPSRSTDSWHICLTHWKHGLKVCKSSHQDSLCAPASALCHVAGPPRLPAGPQVGWCTIFSSFLRVPLHGLPSAAGRMREAVLTPCVANFGSHMDGPDATPP